MAFIDGSDEARQFVADTDDPEIAATRRALEEGQAQPTPISTMFVGGNLEQVAVAPGTSGDLPLPLDLEPTIEALDGNSDLRAMLVIRERSITDNTFTVHLELGTASSIEEPASEDEDGFVTELFFFDHVDGEMHELGHVLMSDEPLGHYRLDATDAVRFLAESGAVGDDIVLRVTVRPLSDDIESTTDFTMGGVTIELFFELV
jgi:hypothetical protein